MSDRQTLVVTLGTSVLTCGSKQLNRAHIFEIARECAQAIAKGHRLVIVTSGGLSPPVGSISAIPNCRTI